MNSIIFWILILYFLKITIFFILIWQISFTIFFGRCIFFLHSFFRSLRMTFTYLWLIHSTFIRDMALITTRIMLAFFDYWNPLLSLLFYRTLFYSRFLYPWILHSWFLICKLAVFCSIKLTSTSVLSWRWFESIRPCLTVWWRCNSFRSLTILCLSISCLLIRIGTLRLWTHNYMNNIILI